MDCYIRCVGATKQTIKIERKQQHSNLSFDKITKLVFDCPFDFN